MFDGVGALFNFGGKIIDKIWPDKIEAEKAKMRLFELQQQGAFKELEAELEKARMQVSVNTAEAQSGSNFRGGWRPFIGWICGLGLLYSVLVQPIATGFIQAFSPGHADFVMPTTDVSALMALLFGMLGLGSFRTYEKTKKLP